MNVKILTGVTSGQINEMFGWCRDNKIPIIEEKMTAWNYRVYHGSKSRWDASNPSKYYFHLIIRERDYPLWQLRFG